MILVDIYTKLQALINSSFRALRKREIDPHHTISGILIGQVTGHWRVCNQNRASTLESQFFRLLYLTN